MELRSALERANASAAFANVTNDPTRRKSSLDLSVNVKTSIAIATRCVDVCRVCVCACVRACVVGVCVDVLSVR